MNLHRFQRNRGTVHRPARLALLALMLGGSLAAQASVVITGTRVVYPANQKEVTVRFENKNPKPALVQVWLDSGNEDATPEEARVPFIATPPIFRMEPGRQQVLRLSYTGEPLPANQESLFWLNMLEVPPKVQASEQENQLQLAFRTRIKVFFRPPDLPLEASQAADKLRWALVHDAQGRALEVTNPTPYHLSFDSVELLTAGQRHAKQAGQAAAENMVTPHASNRFPLPGLSTAPATDAQVEFQVIDDYGARHLHKARLAP